MGALKELSNDLRDPDPRTPDPRTPDPYNIKAIKLAFIVLTWIIGVIYKLIDNVFIMLLVFIGLEIAAIYLKDIIDMIRKDIYTFIDIGNYITIMCWYLSFLLWVVGISIGDQCYEGDGIAILVYIVGVLLNICIWDIINDWKNFELEKFYNKSWLGFIIMSAVKIVGYVCLMRVGNEMNIVSNLLNVGGFIISSLLVAVAIYGK